MTKLSSVDLKNNQDGIVNRVKAWLKKTRKVEAFAIWSMAGSGNYEKTKNDARYREGCNTYRGSITCEDHLIKALKPLFNRCNKLDCETCYTHSASKRARAINEKMLSFKEQCEKKGERVGNVVHVILSPVKFLTLFLLVTYAGFFKLRRNVYKILKDAGIYTGYVFFHLWSLKCRNCGKEEGSCECERKQMYWAISPHFHALGFGYLINAVEFREKHGNWVYVNAGRREEAYTTAFYLLTHVAMWRSTNGRLNPAYMSYGILRSKNFKLVKRTIKYEAYECEGCKKAKKDVIDGLDVIGDRPHFKSSVSLLDKAKKLGVKTEGLSTGHIRKVVSECVYNNKNFRLRAFKRKLKLGSVSTYAIVEKKYNIVDFAPIRKQIRESRKNIKNNKRASKETQKKEGNGYG